MPAVTPAVALLTPEVSALMRQLQCLDDAIGFRLHRLSLPCAHCLHGSGGLCPRTTATSASSSPTSAATAPP
jgi:hypothetical protein